MTLEEYAIGRLTSLEAENDELERRLEKAKGERDDIKAAYDELTAELQSLIQNVSDYFKFDAGSVSEIKLYSMIYSDTAPMAWGLLKARIDLIEKEKKRGNAGEKPKNEEKGEGK